MARSLITGKEMDEDNPLAAAAAGIGFSSPVAVAAMSPEKAQEQRVAEVMQANAEKATSEEGLDAEDLEMAARAFIDGLWFNKSEELGSAITAMAVSVLNPDLARGKDFNQIRKEILSSMEAESAIYAEENRGTAGVANVAGGILSPASLLSGGLLANAYKLRKGAQAARSADEVAMALGGQFALRSGDAAKLAAQYGAQQAAGTGAQVLGRAAQKLATATTPGGGFVPLAVPAAGIAAAEGAVFGYEGATDEEKVMNSAFTAGISAAVPFAFAGVKLGYNEIAKSRIAQQLGKGADFVSLMFTEHGVAPAYKYVISKAYGGASMMEQQARRIVGKMVTPAAARKAAQDLLEDANRKASRAKVVVRSKSGEKLDQKILGLEDKIAKAKEEAANASDAERWRHEEAISLYERAKTDAQAAKVVAVKEADEAVNSAEAGFRGRALRESAPPKATDEELRMLGTMDVHDANAYLDDLWKSHGFKAGNDKIYTLEPAAASNRIKEIGAGFPELSLIGGERGNIVAAVTGYVKTVLGKESRELTGKELQQIGSDIGRTISALSDSAPSAKRFASEVQDYFHDLLESGLNEDEIAELAADRAAWGVRRLFDDAVASVSGVTAGYGNFTTKDWLGAVKGYSSRFAARGAGRLQREAESINKAAQAAKQSILDLADDEAKVTLKNAVEARRQSLGQMLKMKGKIASEKNKEISRLKKKQAAAKANSAEKLNAKNEIIEAQRKFDEQMIDLDGKVEAARRELEELKDMMPDNFKASVFERLFNTALIGQVLAAPTPIEKMGATLATGGGGAWLLSRELTQRILAGQTAGQAAMRGFGETASGVVERGGAAARTSGGQAAAISQLVEPMGTELSERDRERISNLPRAAKGRVYRILERDGRLERIKAEAPKLYEDLKRSAGT